MNDTTSIYCPWCHRYTAVFPAPVRYVDRYGNEDFTQAVWAKSNAVKWWIGVCNSCHEPVLVLNNGVKVYPPPLPSQTNESIPEAIRTDLDEAKICFSVGAYRACAVMARRAMQMAALEKGATKDKLVAQIAQLLVTGKITEEIKRWADAIRWVGNDAAHPDGVPVIKEDAEGVLKLAEQFLHVLYVTPALASGIKKRLGKE